MKVLIEREQARARAKRDEGEHTEEGKEGKRQLDGFIGEIQRESYAQ